MISTIAYPFTVGVGSRLDCDTDSSELAWLRLLAFFGGKSAEKAGNCGCISPALKVFGGYISPRLG